MLILGAHERWRSHERSSVFVGALLSPRYAERAGEDCDDGNAIGGDGCEADCTSSDELQPIWTLELGGPTGFVDCGSGVAFDCAGNLIVAAYTESQIWIRKYDANYVEQWTVTYPGIPGAGACPMVAVYPP